MSVEMAGAAIRLTVLADEGRTDLAVPIWADLSLVAESCAEVFGGGIERTFITAAGGALRSDQPVAELGLSDGDILVATSRRVSAPGAAAALDAPARVAERVDGRAGLVAAAGVCALGAGALAGLAGGPQRVAALVVLLVSTVAILLPYAARHPWRRPALAALLPAVGAGLGLGAALSNSPGGDALGVGVGAMAAVVVAAVVRGQLDDRSSEPLLVWLIGGSVVAVLAAVCVASGASLRSLAALVLGAGIIAARLLPLNVIDVPDRALLDIDRLAVTAWSARERPRAGRRRTAVRPEGVIELLKRGHRLLAAGAVAVAVVVVVAGPVLAALAIGGSRVEEYGSFALIGLGAASLSLLVRSFRSRVARISLRLASAWVVGFTAILIVAHHSSLVGWSIAGGAAVLGVIAIATGLAIGRGWRSVWWARMGEIAESFAMVLAIAAIPFACGLFTAVRQLAS